MKNLSRRTAHGLWGVLIALGSGCTYDARLATTDVCQVQYSPVSIAFGDVVQGDPVTKDLVFSNAGQQVCYIWDVLLTPDAGFTFDSEGLDAGYLGPGVSMILQPGMNHQVQITCDGNGPAQGSLLHAALVFNSNDPDQPDAGIPVTATLQGRPTGITFVTSPVTEGVCGQTYVYDAQAAADGGVVFSLLAPPEGMTIDTAGGMGQVSWTPSVEQEGTHIVTLVAATDADSAQQVFQVNVDCPATMLEPIRGCDAVGSGSGALLFAGLAALRRRRSRGDPSRRL